MQKEKLQIELKRIILIHEIDKSELKGKSKEGKEEVIKQKLEELHSECFYWAYANGIISKKESHKDEFFINNSFLKESIEQGAFVGIGAAGATAAYGSVVTTGTGLAGYFGSATLASAGFGTVATSATVAVGAIAAPLVLASGAYFVYSKNKEDKQNKEIIQKFEKEKDKVLSFYTNKIGKI